MRRSRRRRTHKDDVLAKGTSQGWAVLVPRTIKGLYETIGHGVLFKTIN